MGWVKRFLPIFLMLLAVSFATVIESGDNGAQFSATKASAICKEEKVEAVYICLGNVVKAVSSEPSKGSTFYKPDGRIVICPVVAPTDMGGECLQMMVPNYCPGTSVCGSTPEKTFPGQNDTPEQAVAPTYEPPLPVVYDKNQSAEVSVQPATPKLNQTVPVEQALKTNDSAVVLNSDKAPSAASGGFEFALDNLLLIVLGLGVVGVAVLFALFRGSLNEDEESS